MAVNLSPVGGVAAQFFTNSGAVLTGGKIFTYAAGTTTPAATYTTSQGNVAWTNPIVLDAAGRVPSGGEIWLTDGLIYKFVLKDANDVLIATYDNITGINSNAVAYTNQQEIVMATAGQTVFNLGISYQPGTNSLSVFVDGVNQYGPGAQYSYVETDANTVTFNNGLHVGAEVKFTTTQQQGAGIALASQISYEPPFIGAVTTNVQARLEQTVSVKDFGAVGDGVVDDTAAIQDAIDTGFTALCPPGTYKTTQPLIIGSKEHLHLMSGATIYGMSATNQPVIRLVADYAKLTGDGTAIIRTDNLTGNLNDPTKEGIVNGGPLTMTSPKVDLNWWEISGITFIGNVSVWNQFQAGTSLAIDDYICVNLVNGQALPGIGAGSVYNGWIKDCVFSFAGIGVNCEPVVQGNNFYNLYFYNISKGGVGYLGSGENSLNQTFFHGGACEAFVWMQSVPLKIANAVGVFVPNETVTGAISGATLTLFSAIPYDAAGGYLYGVRTGAFVSGEALTGSNSGATAIVDSTRFQYAMTAEGVGRRCFGNSVTNLMGEPDSNAPAGVGGRDSRFVYIYDGNDFNYIQGRGNTGHAWIDWGDNTIIERGQIETDRPIYLNDTAYISDAAISGGYADVDRLTVGGLTAKPIYNGSLNAGQKVRMLFTGVDRRSYQFMVRASGQWTASNNPVNHPKGIFAGQVLVESGGATIYTGGFTALYEENMAASNVAATAVGSGFQFYLDVTNPSANPCDGFAVEVECVSFSQPTLVSITVI